MSRSRSFCLLERKGREGRGERSAARSREPQPRVVLDVRLRHGDLDPARGGDDGRQRGDGALGDLLERLVEVLPLVVRHEAVFLREVRAPVAREGKEGFLRVDLDGGLRPRRLEPVRDAVVVGAEHDRVAALHLEPQLGVALGDLRGSPRHGRLDHAVDARGLRGADLGADAQHDVVHVERQRRAVDEQLGAQAHAEAQPLGCRHAKLDAAVRRAQRVGGLRCLARRRQAEPQNERCGACHVL